MKRFERLAGVWVAVFCFALLLPADAAVRIEGDATPNYITITNALASASAGAVILVSTGTYEEIFNIYDRTVTIAGGYNHDCTIKLANTGSSLRALAPFYGMVVDIDHSTVLLKDLAISGGMWLSGTALFGGGLHIRNASTVQVERCRIFNNQANGYGGGLYSVDSYLYISNSLIYSNVAGKTTSGAYYDGRGGGIAVRRGAVTVNDSAVRGNAAGLMGGGIFVGEGSRCVLTNGNTAVRFNTATNGGGIAVMEASMLEVLAGTDVCGNQAYEHGGGLFLRNNSTGIVKNTGTYIGYNAFDMGPNIAATDGGGISAENSRVEIGQAARVAHNRAARYGGGIFLSNTVCVISNAYIGNVSGFAHTNEAQNGGGVFMYRQCQLVMTNATLHGNRSTSAGGGIYAYGGNTISMHNSIVRYNTADSYGGGGIYIYNTSITGRNSAIHNNTVLSGSDGGGLWAYQCNGLFDSTSFSTNTASGNGGGISWVSGPILGSYPLTLLGGYEIANNQAGTNGGGIALQAPANITSALFADNDAGHHGGALYITNGAVTLNDTSFEYNRADSDSDLVGNGGGLWVGGAATVTVHTALAGFVEFGGNQARLGGGLYVEDRSVVTVEESVAPLEFYNNTAWVDGGGLAVVESTFTMTGGVLFAENRATRRGGGAFIRSSRALFSGGVSFGDADTNNVNRAFELGGGLSALHATVLLSRVSFMHNTASNYSGGADFEASRVFGTNVTFVGNRTFTSDGGGLAGFLSEGLFQNLVFSNNIAYRNGGGCSWEQGTLSLSSGAAVSNEAADGGGFFFAIGGVGNFREVAARGNRASRHGGGVMLAQSSRLAGTNLYLEANIADSNYDLLGLGGGLMISGYSRADLLGTNGQVCISGNSAVLGGGIAVSNGYLQASGLVWMEGNRATNGGGLYLAAGTTDVMNAYFVKNEAAFDGGGLIMLTNTRAVLRNCALAENKVGLSRKGGGLYNQGGRAVLVSCTVFSNAVSGVECSAGSSLDIGGSIVYDHSLINVTPGYNVEYSNIQGAYAGAGNFDAPPLLYAGNYHLTGWSPCRNAGWAASGEWDVDGELRTGNVDVGFDEFVDGDGDQLPDLVETGTGTWISDTDMGSDPANPDSDGDGIPDGEEWLADTDPNEASSALLFTDIYRISGTCFFEFTGGINSIQYFEVCRDLGTNGPQNWQIYTTISPPTPSPGLVWLGMETNAYYRLRARRPGF